MSREPNAVRSRILTPDRLARSWGKFLTVFLLIILNSCTPGSQAVNSVTPSYTVTPLESFTPLIPTTRVLPSSTGALTSAVSSSAVPTEMQLTGTPAGSGAIVIGNWEPIATKLGQFFPTDTAWIGHEGDVQITVFVGSSGQDPQQGVVNLVRSDSTAYPLGLLINSPGKSGGLRITDARGERLILVSSGGSSFYFDVPSAAFVDSLDQIIPSATPGPTFTPRANVPQPFDDDAPDAVWQVWQASPTDTELHFTISPAGDQDWFSFQFSNPSTVNVTLSAPRAGYTLTIYPVVSPDDVNKVGGNDKKQLVITLPNAASGAYYVGVEGAPGYDDGSSTYLLTFSTK